MGSGSHSSKRKRKRSQKRSKKRSRRIREKTKKLKRRHDSISSSDEEDSASTNSLSCSSCSSEHGYRRSKRRARSRDRRDRKGHKKRAKRDSSLSGSSGDSPRVKKWKRSRRNEDSDLRKKRRRKIRKREPSISSSSEPSDDSGREMERKERKGREMSRERSASKGRHSSRSFSPRSYHSEEGLMEEYQPKRLKSVIVARVEIEEPQVEESNRDNREDEIVYEHDDYPSKSNDSNDGLGRRDSLMYLDDASYENPNREVVDVGISELPVNDDQFEENGNEISTTSAGSNPANLEAILRQKALENLLKRQGKLPTKVTDEEGSIQSVQKLGKNDDVKHNANVVEKGNVSGDHVISRSKLGLSISTRRLLGSSNTWKRKLSSHESFQSIDKGSDKGFESAPSCDTKVVAEKVDSAAASEASPSGEKSTKDETNDDDEDSQFQQKTMCVMRGGEMVQVSYKVKIPKKAPALARRQLNR